MSVLTAVILLFASLIYVTILVLFLNNYVKHGIVTNLFDQGPKEFKLFFYEKRIVDSLDLKPEKIKAFIYVERVVLCIAVISLLMLFKGLAFAGIGALVAVVIFDDMYKARIDESGIMNIPTINNFINYFVPHINSGNSADQSLLGYISYSEDENLAEYYENLDNPNYELKKYVQQIADIYDIAKYNEEKGISDYSYILNEIAESYQQKQDYYNSFIEGMGEIRPTVWSYYVGVPLLIVISFNQTVNFWNGLGGFILGAVLLAIFVLFKFLIYKLQKSTIIKIF